MNRETWLVILFTFLFASLIKIWLTNKYGTRDTISLFDIRACSVGQDISLRQTTGQAVYEVTFKDGEAVSFTCISNQESK